MNITIDNETAYYYLIRSTALEYQVLVTFSLLPDLRNADRLTCERAAAAINSGMPVMIVSDTACSLVSARP
ncbi:hypothetical protein [Enterovibrio coralii]|uniref:Uncharacterized protein n=1 Tax=Enterovibrio coralii TaxID=294935 RepID=A0A135I6Y2_9GAMM|nr:hypothetical protein [Enterovibrio coralii]KXF81211.1 hypothetical protein ATN88_00105 [Enterovibrio coralii]